MTSARDSNPYRPPPPSSDDESWWAQLRRLLFGENRVSVRRLPVFAAGDAVICGGIAYSIDPDDPAVFFAASPSSDHGDERLALVVEEALRYLPGLLEENPQLRKLLVGRRLSVRIINSYEEVHSGVGRIVDVDPAAVLRAMQSSVETGTPP